jgi:ribonuclease HII
MDMPWLIGIDEAGYGPNLGPFVMSAVACRVPAEHSRANLWDVLRAVVRRQGDDDDGRLFVDDSKLVYSTARGIRDLETAVLAWLSPSHHASLGELVSRLSRAGHDELCQETWYTGATKVPLEADPIALGAAALKFKDACTEQSLDWPIACSVIVCPARFNSLVDQWQSKGIVLSLGMCELIRACCAAADGDEPLLFCIDKHGGRNHYSAVLQTAFDDGFVVAREEGALRSTYHVIGLDRSITFTIQPRADSAHMCVALASMVSKYLREALMGEFNRFWQQHVPGLEPTAGYPGDSGRFRDAVRTARDKLQISDDCFWRKR